MEQAVKSGAHEKTVLNDETKVTCLALVNFLETLEHVQHSRRDLLLGETGGGRVRRALEDAGPR